MELAWFLFILPLASAIAIHFVLKKRPCLSGAVGTVVTLAALVVAFFIRGAQSELGFNWISLGNFEVNIGFVIDKLSSNMMLIVTGIGSLVHIFSLAYMKEDKAKARYFGNLSLFMFSMTGIVLSSNLVMTFIFWELVGLSSYLLIGHWYEKHSAGDAAKKAFLTNRIGDFGFMIGILMLWSITGTVNFSELAANPPAATCALSIAVFMIFLGAMGKSAQAPLHVWLPDAMEGPTPVSALIHAATMVAAGVYMMARVFLVIGTDVISTLGSVEAIAWIGGITSLLAALMATQQNDIKKILAYSTLSQLGYMVMAVGLVNPDAGMFHLYTHAWFKALLFLGSGAIIYACHHDQNIWNMGGLLKRMPITSLTFIFGTLALTAVPFTAGFYSKESILHAAKDQGSYLLWVALGVAALTTFYMFRLIFVAILGKAKHKHSEDAKEVSMLMLAPLVILVIVSALSPFFSDFVPLPELKEIDFHVVPHFGDKLVLFSIGAFVLGFIPALLLYAGKTKDPLNIPLFRNKFYIDEIFGHIIKWGQDILAAVVHFLDEFVINGLLVGGVTRSAQGLGNLFRSKIQTGNIQTYAFMFGIGIAITIYITVFA